MSHFSKIALCLLPAMALAACGPVESRTPVGAPPAAVPALNPVGVDRLLNNKGLSLQWISWDVRGTVDARMEGDGIRLTGRQGDPAGNRGLLTLDGKVQEIGPDYFTFRGKISITDTPDVGRHCELDKLWHFAITQDRKYYRLREFEWCDGLTDYVDIYFSAAPICARSDSASPSTRMTVHSSIGRAPNDL